MTVSALSDIDFAGETSSRQLAIPGMDGYQAEKLSLAFSGGIDFNDVTQAEDVEFVKAFKLGQEVRLTVSAVVTRKGFTLTPGRDEMTDDKTTYGVTFKVQSVELPH